MNQTKYDSNLWLIHDGQWMTANFLMTLYANGQIKINNKYKRIPCPENWMPV